MKSARKSLIVIGSANMDLLTRVKAFPRAGETQPGKALVHRPGGKGANQAIAAVQAGAKVEFIGNIGKGTFGEALVANLKREKVKLSHLERSAKLPAGTALILLNEEGENQIVVTQSSNDLVSVAQIRKAKELIQGAGLVLMQLEVPLAAVTAAISIAHAAKVPAMLNPAPVTQPLPADLLRRVTWLTPNEHELAVLTGLPAQTKAQIETGSQRLLQQGVQNVVVTCGARGACWASAQGVQWFPARKVRVTDTVGAGDCFAGTLAAGLCAGNSPMVTIRKAVAAASARVSGG